MPFTFKLSVRLALMKAPLLVAAAVCVACKLPAMRGPTSPTSDVTQVVTSPDTVVLDPYQTRQFVAFGRTQAGDSVAVTVRWSATGGTITTAGPYSAIATQNGGANADTAAIAVMVVPVALVSVSPATASVAVGQTAQLTATPLDANGNALNGRAVTWSTTSPAVATVDANGLV